MYANYFKTNKRLPLLKHIIFFMFVWPKDHNVVKIFALYKTEQCLQKFLLFPFISQKE